MCFAPHDPDAYVGLVAVGLWLLALSLVGPTNNLGAKVFAWLSGISTFVFVIYYTALDSIGGVGLGRSIEATERLAAEGRLTPEQVQGVALVLDTIWTDPIIGGVRSYISLTGSWAIFFATLFAAAALFLSKRAPWPPLIILVAFGWELQLSDAMPHGPIAFGLLIIFALWIWFARRREQWRSGEGMTRPAEATFRTTERLSTGGTAKGAAPFSLHSATVRAPSCGGCN